MTYKIILILLLLPLTVTAQGIARYRPEVHSVQMTEQTVEIRSAGTSLTYFGPLQTPMDHVERVRQLRFRIPRRPVPANGAHQRLRSDAIGVFVTGVPVYNPFESLSYQGQDLWHFDSIAMGDDGSQVTGGRPRIELAHVAGLGVLEALIADASRHSPIIGYAFDGYPIYGPWADVDGRLRPMRSSYRLRKIDRRATWPDGTRLTPAQEGPPVDAAHPLGSFVEDYEYVAGGGDLDEFNGRFVRTPEYPNGTYAYFLSTDGMGRLAYPYVIGPRYFGKLSIEELRGAIRDEAVPIAPASPAGKTIRRSNNLELQLDAAAPMAGQPVRLSFQAKDANGAPIRHLEIVHEKPMHLLIVSEDLAEFDHIHPERVVGDRYEVAHQFKHGGTYRLYADFAPPGAAQRVEVFDLVIRGAPRATVAMAVDRERTKTLQGITLQLDAGQPIRAGEDLEFRLTLRNAAIGKPIHDLEPYLGAWAHFVLIDQRKESFIHAHPLGEKMEAHSHEIAGPSPPEIRFLASFPRAGLYKLWAQFQRHGRVLVQPFVLRVEEGGRKTKMPIPSGAISMAVGAQGFQTGNVQLPADRPVTLAVTRDSQPNCAKEIVFPSLGLRRALPLGETVLIELPALPAGELRFACGMGMYKAVVPVR